jgi:hypothetical protein
MTGPEIDESKLSPASCASSENVPSPPSPQWWKFWRWPLTGPATVVLAFATFGLALVSYRTLIELREGARAFVATSVSLTATRDPTNNTVDFWRVVVSLENSGNTQTQDMNWSLNIGGIDISPDPEKTDIQLPVSPSDSGQGVLLPKAKIPIIDSVFTRTKIAEVIKGRGAYYIGLVRYNDVFHQPWLIPLSQVSQYVV